MPREETWFERNQRLAEEFADIVYNRFIVEAMFSAAIKLPLDHEIKILIGYNPQLLLEHKPISVSEWAKLYADAARGMLPNVFSDMMMPPKEIMPYFEHQKAVVFPTGRLHFDHIKPPEPWPHKMAVIKIVDMDFSAIEATILATIAAKADIIRSFYLDIDSPSGDIPGRDILREAMAYTPKPKEKAKKQNGRDAEYLKRGGFAGKRYRK